MVRSQQKQNSNAMAHYPNEMDSLFDAFFRPVRQSGITSWLPPINISESESDYRVDVELPGVAAQDVEVELHDGKLKISGNRSSEQESSDRRYHRVEHAYGSFERVLKLGGPVEEDNVSAEFDNGVLSVTIPKSEEAKPRRIEITSK